MSSPGAFVGSPTKRREMDVMKLMMSNYEVKPGESINEFFVKFKGPEDTPYVGGQYLVRVTLQEGYPYKSPSIGFCTRIYHPNVDERSGTVCLDVINQTWTPLFDLVNIFDSFLPQLLTYPNPTDPLNPEAAALMLRDPERYKQIVQDHVSRHAKAEINFDDEADGVDGADAMDDDDDAMSDVSGGDAEPLDLEL